MASETPTWSIPLTPTTPTTPYGAYLQQQHLQNLQNPPHIVAAEHSQYLTDEEIEQFLDDLDHNGDGLIDYDEVEEKLDATYDELFPRQQQQQGRNQFNNSSSSNNHATKKKDGNTSSGSQTPMTQAGTPMTENFSHNQDMEMRHQFLRAIIGSDQLRIPRHEFAARVREWRIPSLALEGEGTGGEYVRKMSVWRRARAYWAVHGPEIVFLGLVISMQVAFAIWQCVKFSIDRKYVEAFGWGVVLAKTTAGALYPTMFFLVLSMSRYCSTFLRRSYYLSRFINWDLSQSFHIKISIVAVSLSTLHAIGHFTGTFNNGSKEINDEFVDKLIGDLGTQRTYESYLNSLPGWTGITALVLFYVIGTLSTPWVRKWNYEVFQLGHLLMYPIIALLCAHGAAALLQYPMLGFWLAFPTAMILIERVVRLGVGFHRLPATIRVLDGETVQVTTTIPSERLWGYRAGQYVFLQVPQISMWQWHPFTVSVCRKNKIQLHIKTDGNWTRQLRKLAGDSGQSVIEVGINGPFGAPAQRFYDFSHTIVVGSGIGVTPFSGILSDLQARDNAKHGGPGQVLESNGMYSVPGMMSTTSFKSKRRALAKNLNLNKLLAPKSPSRFADDYRRVDFHWTVRERNYLLWMADLLNDVTRSQQWHRQYGNDGNAHLDIRIHTHVTKQRKDIVTHVYSWLLEMYRTDAHPESPLTHLLNPTHLGRPDFVTILDQHYEEMVSFQASRRFELQKNPKRFSRWRPSLSLSRPGSPRSPRPNSIVQFQRSPRPESMVQFPTSPRPESITQFPRSPRSPRPDSQFHIRSDSQLQYSRPDSQFTMRPESQIQLRPESQIQLRPESLIQLRSESQLQIRQESQLRYEATPGAACSPVPIAKSPRPDGSGQFHHVRSDSRAESISCSLAAPGPVYIPGEPTSYMSSFSPAPSPRPGSSHSFASNVFGSAYGTYGLGGEDETLRVGVFYCGHPVVGEILADRCRALTARSHKEGSKIEYHFMTEVFS